MIKASICLSDIPKECIINHANGKKYLNIIISARQTPDKFGNTETIYVSQTQEERQAGHQKQYIGNGVTVQYQGSQQAPPQTQQAPPQNYQQAPQQGYQQQGYQQQGYQQQGYQQSVAPGQTDDLPF